MNQKLPDVQVDFKMAEEPEIKLPTSAGSQKKKGIPEETSPSDLWSQLTALTVNHNKGWKILKDLGMVDHFTCLLRNLYAGQEATVRTLYGTTNWFKMGKEHDRAVCSHPVCLTYKLSTS